MRYLLALFILFSIPVYASDCLYTYRAKVIDVYDGDTITVDIDLGFGVWKRGEKLRLAGIDAPEIRGATKAQGLTSRDRLSEQIIGKEILIETTKDKQEKYGRYLAILWLDGRNLNDWLVTEKLARYREY